MQHNSFSLKNSTHMDSVSVLGMQLQWSKQSVPHHICFSHFLSETHAKEVSCQKWVISQTQAWIYDHQGYVVGYLMVLISIFLLVHFCSSFFFFTHDRLECIKAQRMEVIPITIFTTATKENEFHVEYWKRQEELHITTSEEVSREWMYSSFLVGTDSIKHAQSHGVMFIFEHDDVLYG